MSMMPLITKQCSVATLTPSLNNAPLYSSLLLQPPPNVNTYNTIGLFSLLSIYQTVMVALLGLQRTHKSRHLHCIDEVISCRLGFYNPLCSRLYKLERQRQRILRETLREKRE